MAKPRNRQEPEVRRAGILAAAIAVLGERGYFGFTLRDLAQRVGLTNAGLLHYFASKELVMLGVLEELEAREAVQMQPLADAALRAGGNAPAARAVLCEVVARATQNPALIRLFVELQSEALNSDHPAHLWYRHRVTRTAGFFATLLAPHVADAEPRARQLLAMMDGLALQFLHGQIAAIGDEWDIALAALVPELGPKTTERAPLARIRVI